MSSAAALTADLFENTALDVQPADPLHAIGFEIGWDFAHHRMTPPVEHLAPEHPVRRGWQAGRAVFGAHTLRATPKTYKWLQLRLSAWLHGRTFEGLQVTPHFLGQIEVAVCPVTREPLGRGSGISSDASVDRVRNSAGYAAGNLAVMSVRASRAKSDLAWDAAMRKARQIEAGRFDQIDGLDAAQWRRMAVLMSFVTHIPHADAACLPLLMLPPNRLRVLNPVQALQVLLTTHFMRPGPRPRIADLATAIPAAACHEFNVFMLTMQARRLAVDGRTGAPALRHAMEDVWTQPTLNRRWQRFALQLTEADCERLVRRLAERGLAAPGWQWIARAAATEGWALETGGYASLRPRWPCAKPPVKAVTGPAGTAWRRTPAAPGVAALALSSRR